MKKEEERVMREEVLKRKGPFFVRFLEVIYKFPGSPNPCPLHTKKMAKINVESFSEDNLAKRYSMLARRDLG